MHHTQATTTLGYSLNGTRPTKPENIVNHVGTRINDALHDLGLERVDRQGHIQRLQGFDDRQKTRQFLLGINRFGPWPGRFSANVDNIGTL